MALQNRSILTREQNELRTKIIGLGSMVDEALLKAMDALTRRDSELAREIIQDEEAINQLRYDVEKSALVTIATQQPTARDLREIIAAIHIAIELERMGDHAADIASLAERLEGEGEFDTLHKLPKMAKRAQKMIQEGITAYTNRDVALARKMISRDDKLDRQYYQLRHEVLQEMRDDDYIRRATFLLWVGHDLERIGDRATNIAERVIFMVSAEFVETPSNYATPVPAEEFAQAGELEQENNEEETLQSETAE